MSIQNLGTFSFAMRTVDIGNNRSIALQRPVFLLSEKFAQTHCIRYAKQHAPGECIIGQTEHVHWHTCTFTYYACIYRHTSSSCHHVLKDSGQDPGGYCRDAGIHTHVCVYVICRPLMENNFMLACSSISHCRPDSCCGSKLHHPSQLQPFRQRHC